VTGDEHDHTPDLAERYRLQERWALTVEQTALANGYNLALTVTPDGDFSVWLLRLDGSRDQGCADCADHEQLGRLPDEWRRRIDGTSP
jgi:hypothetical protein